jgi:hypothetical protein
MVEKNIAYKDFIERILDSLCDKYGIEKILIVLIDKLNNLIEKNPRFLENLDISLDNLEEQNDNLYEDIH